MYTPLFRSDPNFLALLGVQRCRGPVPIPIYAQKIMVDDDLQPIPGMIVSHVEDVPTEQQLLMSLLLQIIDGQAFRRYSS